MLLFYSVSTSHIEPAGIQVVCSKARQLRYYRLEFLAWTVLE